MHPATLATAFVIAASLLSSPASAERAGDEGVFFIGKPARVESGRSVEAAVVIGDDLVIAGDVDGLAAAIGGDLPVLSGAHVDGAVAAIGGELRIDPGAIVKGPRIAMEGGDFGEIAARLSDFEVEPKRPSIWLGSVMRVAQVLALFVIALFIVALAPKRVENVRQTLGRQALWSGVIGLAMWMGIVPLCLLLTLSLIGIPLIPVAIIALLAVCTLGMTAVGAMIGYATPALRGRSGLLGATALGMLALAIGAAIPVFGGLMLFVASSFGSGAVWLSRFGARTPAEPAVPDAPLPPSEPAPNETMQRA